MALFGWSQMNAAERRLAEEDLYAHALREIESGVRRDGIWAKALSESNMDQRKAAARYIDLRVQALKDEIALTAQQAELATVRETKRQQELLAKEAALAEENMPRHGSCGGILDRTETRQVIKWKCRKCHKSGSIKLGVSYAAGSTFDLT